MNRIWIITKRELATFFDSLTAYVMIVVFLGLSGFFTWLSVNNIFVLGQARLDVFFGISFWTLFFFIPAITMRSIAEENKTGTIELLSTKAITDWDIVVGKFLGCLLLVFIALLCTIPYYVTVSQLGNVDHGGIIGGYLGLALISATYVSIGIFASSITSNQIVAFLLALSIGIFFHLLFDVISSGLKGSLGSFIEFLSARAHFDSLSRGVVDSRDLLFFFSIILGGLVLSTTMISRRNWQN
jgi:ABC-2 type transport system permease protein